MYNYINNTKIIQAFLKSKNTKFFKIFTAISYRIFCWHLPQGRQRRGDHSCHNPWCRRLPWTAGWQSGRKSRKYWPSWAWWMCFVKRRAGQNQQLKYIINESLIYILWLRFIFVYQTSLRRTFKTVFWVKNHPLNMCSSAVISQ